MFRRVYLDNSATTPIAAEVLEAMMPYLTDKFGNASSIHFFGQEARAAVDRARHQAAELINARPTEIVFTSGGTEANNLAIRGLIDARDPVHVITCTTEHSAVKGPCKELERLGCNVSYLPVDETGLVSTDAVRGAIQDNTVLVSLMTANNEIGTIHPVVEVGRLVKERRNAGQKIWFHTDAVQAVGKIRVDVEEIGCDLLSLSGHKINAPKGIGALYIRRGVRLRPQNIGGRQERERRGGTESVPLIAALGAACALAEQELEENAERLARLRDRFEDSVFETIPDVVLNGDPERRLPGISSISFRRVEGEALLINLDMQGIAISTGSACSSGSLEPSPVIRALGRDDELARGAIRFSFGRQNSDADLDYVLEALPRAIGNLRKLAPPAV